MHESLFEYPELFDVFSSPLFYYLSICFLDSDLRELPSVPSLVASIEHVLSGEWDVLCAAGMMGHHHTTKYYDTFATILANGVGFLPCVIDHDV
eukprot:m.384386 g.384386  ORF g.384386 m.384386 type:complete len:94 (-) comp20991_c0_seq4:151-432(-)